jgi:hypothetical protein
VEPTDDEALFPNDNNSTDIFNETPPTPEPGTDAGTEPAADGLVPPAEDAPPQPADEQPAEGEDELDDLFGANGNSGARLVSLRQQAWRSWTDDTGWYQTRGQLVSISDSGIRILKDNGRHCTVPFDRLSSADVSYVVQLARRVVQDSAVTVAER